MEVPQGAGECVIGLFKQGKLHDTRVATATLETKRHMLDRPDFWGERQVVKLESSGTLIGTLLITFRKAGDGAGGGVGSSSSSAGPAPHEGHLIPGIEEDSALGLELQRIATEANKKGPFQGDAKLGILSVALTGYLREINKKGKATGRAYIRLMHCNVADLMGDERDEERLRQLERAKKRGLPREEKKWYWVYYEDKKAAERRSSHPDGYLPMAAITSIHRSPSREDQFVIRYTEDRDKKELTYRLETGKGLDVWVEGLDEFTKEVRKQYRERLLSEAKVARAVGSIRSAHDEFASLKGKPTTQGQWRQWYDHLKSLGHDEAAIRQLWTELEQKQPPPKRLR